MIIRINGVTLPPHAFEQILEALRVHDHTLTQEELEEKAVDTLVEKFIITEQTNDIFADIPEAELNEAFAALKESHGGEELFYKALGLNKSHEDIIKKDLNQQMKVERFLADLTKDIARPSDKMAKQYFDRNPEAKHSPEKRHVYNFVHKFNPNEMQKVFKKMQRMRRQILDGCDFLAIARKESTCENPDLGYFPRGEMLEEFDTIAFSMEKDEVSPVFLTQFGYHIIKVVDIQPAAVKTFEEVKDEVKEMLHADMCRKFIQNWLEQKKSEADIQIIG